MTRRNRLSRLCERPPGHNYRYMSNKKTACLQDADSSIQKAYRRLKKSYRQIKDSYAEMIFRFALAAELKDESTGIHLVRMADYCVEIARSYGLPKKDQELLRYASPMHDIGKLVIPDNILKKKGGLTPAEREIMKKHTFFGADIFQGARSPLLKAAAAISLTHHERFDGTGYPQGLKGRQIPLYGRIVGLADVFEALVDKRPYKAAYPIETALRVIATESGKHFDPLVVRAFFKSKQRIRRILRATKDIDDFVAGF